MTYRKADKRPFWHSLSDAAHLHSQVGRLSNDLAGSSDEAARHLHDMLQQSEELIQALTDERIPKAVAQLIEEERRGMLAHARSRRTLAAIGLVSLGESHQRALQIMAELFATGELEEWIAEPLRERTVQVLKGSED